MSVLARMSETDLRAWLLARMRGEREDPPVDRSRLESPEDHVRAVHDAAADPAFRGRIAAASLGALEAAAAGDLRAGPDARAIRHLAALADGLALRDAASILQQVAERGAFGGHPDGLDPDAEEMVLFALAGLQPQGALWPGWDALWRNAAPRLWPVVTAGLRLSDPVRALAILPEAVRRAASHASFPLGEVLWAFATDERYTTADIARALAGLSPEERRRCRDALLALGADPGEVDGWLAAPSPPREQPSQGAQAPRDPLPPWAIRRGALTRPPRFVETRA
jgi:hypothetical protein